MVEGEELGAIARRVIDSNQFMTINTADEEGVPWVSPAWYALAEYREIFWIRPHIYLFSRLWSALLASNVVKAVL